MGSPFKFFSVELIVFLKLRVHNTICYKFRCFLHINLCFASKLLSSDELGSDTLNPPLTSLEGYPIPEEDVMLLRPEGKREEDVSEII